MSIWSSLDLGHLDHGAPERDNYSGAERRATWFVDIAVSPTYHDNVRIDICGQVSAADARFLAAKLIEAAEQAEDRDPRAAVIDARVAPVATAWIEHQDQIEELLP